MKRARDFVGDPEIRGSGLCWFHENIVVLLVKFECPFYSGENGGLFDRLGYEIEKAFFKSPRLGIGTGRAGNQDDRDAFCFGYASQGA